MEKIRAYRDNCKMEGCDYVSLGQTVEEVKLGIQLHHSVVHKTTPVVP